MNCLGKGGSSGSKIANFEFMDEPLLVQIPVQLFLELKANLLDQNLNELESGLSRM